MTLHGIVLRPGVRALIRDHRPTVWLVLQDVALDADWRDDCLVASTSARLVAEHLHLDPGTVASALRVLRDAGLVELAQSSGPDGRFGLAAYTVRLPNGLDTLAPRPVAPHADEPRTPNPHTVGAGSDLVLRCPWDGEREPTPDLEPSSRQRRRTAAKRPEQGAFDLGIDA